MGPNNFGQFEEVFINEHILYGLFHFAFVHHMYIYETVLSAVICIYIIINGSKISINGFIATMLFRMMEECPHSSSSSESPLNYKHWQLKANLRLLWDMKFSRQLLWDVKTKVNPKRMLQRLHYFITKFLITYLFLWGAQTWLLVPFV